MGMFDKIILLAASLACVARAEMTTYTPNATGPSPAIIFMSPDSGYEMTQASKVSQGWGFVGVAAGLNSTTPDDVAAAVAAVKNMSDVDSSRVAIFGYNNGGSAAISYALSGMSNGEVKAIVSFHAGVEEVPTIKTNITTKMLILSGEVETTPEEIMSLEALLNEVNAPWEITRYAGASFGAAGDSLAHMRSWTSAYDHVQEAFGITMYKSAQPDAITTMEVNYTDIVDGTPLKGHLAMPESKWKRPLPAVIILPDWDGVNEYEQERATALAEKGYVAMAADIFGADKQYVESFEERGALVGYFLGNETGHAKYMSRINSAIEQIKMLDADVNSEEIIIIGYCFGGAGVTLFSALGGSAKAAVAFHGNFGNVFGEVKPIIPFQLVLSGGDDPAHGNQRVLEDSFNKGNADWESTRYAYVVHGFTDWHLAQFGAYSLVADSRSWGSFMEYIHENIPVPQMTNVTTGTMSPTMMGTMSPTMSPSAAPSVHMHDDSSHDSHDSHDDSAATHIGTALSALAMLTVSYLF